MKFIRRIISWIYTLVIVIRHRLYDWGVFKSFSFDIPIVCVGNITVGGTGKTPTAEFILTSLANHYTIAILSRGYGRTTKGYHEVSTNDSYSDVGDEPLQIKLKYPNTVVVVSEDRVAGIERIRKEHPEVNLIIMDDGFQHRRVKAKVNVLEYPLDNAAILSSVKKDASVTVTAYHGDYARIESADTAGYIPAAQLKASNWTRSITTRAIASILVIIPRLNFVPCVLRILKSLV